MGRFQRYAHALAWAAASAAGLAALPAHAGAWPKSPGDGQIILTTMYDSATRGFDRNGVAREQVRFEKKEISAFVEYGVTPGITLVGRAALQDVTIETAAGRERRNGFAATELGLRALVLRRDRDVLSVQATVIVPGDVENVTDLRLGEGDYEYEPRLLYGRGFSALGGYGFAEAQLAWRFCAGAPPDEARADLTLGWRRGRWAGFAQVFVLHGAGARPPRRNYDSVKLQASVMQEIGGSARLQTGVFHTVWGRSIMQETAVFVAIWRDF